MGTILAVVLAYNVLNGNMGRAVKELIGDRNNYSNSNSDEKK